MHKWLALFGILVVLIVATACKPHWSELQAGVACRTANGCVCVPVQGDVDFKYTK